MNYSTSNKIKTFLTNLVRDTIAIAIIVAVFTLTFADFYNLWPWDRLRGRITNEKGKPMVTYRAML